MPPDDVATARDRNGAQLPYRGRETQRRRGEHERYGFTAKQLNAIRDGCVLRQF